MPPDYSGQNLQGRSFKGQNLTGANFSKADIKGANFTNAILKDADFTGTKAGLQRRWTIGLLMSSWLLSGISGFFSITFGVFIAYLFNTEAQRTANFIAGIVCLIVMLVFWIITISKGLTTGLGAVAFAFAFAFAVAFAGAVAFTGAGAGAFAFALAFAVAVAVAFAGAFAVAFAGAFAVAFTGAVAGAFAVIVAITVAVGVAVALTVAFAGAFASAVAGAGAFAVAFTGGFAVVFTLFSAYIGWRSLAGDEKEAWVRSFAIAFAATGGTSFCNADLTDADFTGATLKNTDLRKANLTRTRFYEAKKLDFARVDNLILANRGVLNLLVTGNGREKSYAGANLKGANLIGADLKEANLKGADITEATFQGACLERANLTLAQAVGTNFTSAQMTGACVEAWNIESTTKLDNVDCRFIYLLENPKSETDDRERRPSSGEFQPGEFSKLFEEVLNTVDLIFRDGIDWKAFVNAFQTVQDQNEGTELALQSIENKGDGVVVVKVGVPFDVDKEKIHSDFTQNYQLALQAVEEKYKAQLQAKDEQIVIYRQTSGEMAEIVKLLANKPINVQVDNKVENKNMTNSNDASRKIEIGSVGRDFNASGQALNLGDISGTVTNTINELAASPEPDKPGIKELLTQLQAAIEADTNLPPEDKADALEQVKALAEVGKSPQEGGMQKAGKTAIKILKGTIASLPSATKLVEQCSNLLPLISTFLGLG
ncbi:MAG: pentapeptide repeat-containing protein [Nostoc sp.]|uniref:pentapeptide repeat-containing protein n=1 Tax=unclassified Nostoc TaxID=2593658 RepID=UPI0025DC9D1C|nr:pentapeptide repeat-containing protein [Nostoc sp. NOS(2021)]MBN3899729.1 pentapeptide repeat-containing protein [Nostoc sp. NOS(2021)]